MYGDFPGLAMRDDHISPSCSKFGVFIIHHIPAQFFIEVVCVDIVCTCEIDIIQT